MSKILITGGTGLVGSAFQNIPNVILVGSKDYNLRNRDQVIKMFNDHKPEQVIHLAGKVGGVLGNMTFAADYFEDNMDMNVNVLKIARDTGVKKVISLLSTCVYPDGASYPLSEKYLHTGEPHPSNFSYAYAKRMLDIQSRAYRKQDGLNYICAIPNNLYGENDNFEPIYSHVVPALIRKMYEAKIKNNDEIELWGTGDALRELTYSSDIAKILMMLLNDYDDVEPINIGNIEEISIKDLAQLIRKEIGFEGKIVWNTDKPTGQLRKPSDNTKFKTLYSNFEYTSLEVGIKKTCEWFISNFPENVRGCKDVVRTEKILERKQKNEVKRKSETE